MKYINVTQQNVEELYNRPDGNIYMSEIYDGKTYYDVVEDLSLKELKEVLVEGYTDADFIFIEGPNLGIKVEVI